MLIDAINVLDSAFELSLESPLASLSLSFSLSFSAFPVFSGSESASFVSSFCLVSVVAVVVSALAAPELN